MTGADPEKYGQLDVAEIRRAFNDLRRAVQAGEMDAAQEALDRYEQWADYVFDRRHRPNLSDPDGRGRSDNREPTRGQELENKR